MPSVLVTGASRGIGRAAALRLAGRGWDVYAGVRRREDAAEGLRPVLLDVTDGEQVAALADELPAQLDAVVNNAGIAVPGPIEAVDLDELRRQFEVNVVGQVAVTQAVLPRLRAARGRIVLVGSVSGRVSTPMMGAYTGSKFALEGIADALRMELRPWGIRVSLVEPTSTDTDMWRTADAEADRTVAALSGEHRELYAQHIAGLRKLVGMVQRQTVPVEGVAADVERALTARRPRARYPVGWQSRVQLAMASVTPTPVLDAVLRRAHGIPRKI